MPSPPVPWLASATLAAFGIIGACGKSPVTPEVVGSATLPPITVCYEPDGAPCPPPDAGEDGAIDAGISDATIDRGD